MYVCTIIPSPPDGTAPCPHSLINTGTSGAVPAGVTWNISLGSANSGTGAIVFDGYIPVCATCVQCQQQATITFNGHGGPNKMSYNKNGTGWVVPTLNVYARTGTLQADCSDKDTVNF